MKIFNFFKNNILFFLTLLLLVFIPLYPKLPVINVTNTWVYVRLEDFIVAFTILVWAILFFMKKVNLKTPLTFPILIFWIVGGLSTLHGVLLIFPTISNVFSNVALLSFIREIEYIFLFFVAYSGVKNYKDKNYVAYICLLLVTVMLAVVGYAFGQRYLGFPAFLTMNEQFAKGVGIQLSSMDRLSSTFAGHYDLAAYLVLMISITAGLWFGFKNWFIRIFLGITAFLGFIILYMTVSRVSFFALLFALAMLLVFYKKKWVIVSLLVLSIASLAFFPSLRQRFQNTVSETNVLVDAKTGGALGEIKQVPSTYFDNKVVLRQPLPNQQLLDIATGSSLIYPNKYIPPQALLLVEPNASNGEFAAGNKLH